MNYCKVNTQVPSLTSRKTLWAPQISPICPLYLLQSPTFPPKEWLQGIHMGSFRRKLVSSFHLSIPVFATSHCPTASLTLGIVSLLILDILKLDGSVQWVLVVLNNIMIFFFYVHWLLGFPLYQNACSSLLYVFLFCHAFLVELQFVIIHFWL